jgi:hypothetical protein
MDEYNKFQFMAELRNGEGVDCPCCGRHAQLYKRHIHQTVAKQLVELYKQGGSTKYVHVSHLIPNNQAGAGDFTKAKYWGLIVEQVNDNPKLKTSGNWKLTEKGIDFVEGRQAISKYVKVFDDEVYSFSPEKLYISECFKNGFDYSLLMAGGV